MSLYLSFINDEIEKLEQQIDTLRDMGETLESKCEDIIYDLREQAREAISEAVYEAFEEAGIQDNYMDEKEQETSDAMLSYITNEF